MLSTDFEALTGEIPALRRFARSLTRNADTADDLVQDCIERAMTRWHLFEPGTNLRAWLFTICRRLFLNNCRRAATRGVHVDYEDVISAVPVKPMQEISMELEDVKAAFAELPLNDRVILSLITMEGMKYKEAADLLDLPVGTVRSRLSRARSKLMEKIESRPAVNDRADDGEKGGVVEVQ